MTLADVVSRATITATPKKGGTTLTKSIRINTWYIAGGSGSKWDADNYCNNLSGYDRISDISGILTTNSEGQKSTRGSVGKLWSEWGDMSHYRDSGFSDTWYWISRLAGNLSGKNNVFNIRTGEYSSRGFGETVGIICKKSM